MLHASRRLRAFQRLPHHTRASFTCSQLSSGLRVLTIDNGLLSSAMALLCHGSCAHETDETAGASAVIQSLMLSGTERVQQPMLTRRLEPLGLNLRPMNVREALGWCITVPGYALKEGLSIINDVGLSVTRDEDAFNTAKQRNADSIALMNRDMFRVTFDILHGVAFDGKGLGRSELPSEEQLKSLTLDNVRKYHAQMFQPDRAVLVISGVRASQHDEVVRMVEGSLQFPERPAGAPDFSQPLGGFKGGIAFVHNTEAPESVDKFQEKNLCHVALALKGPKMTDPDYITAALAQTLLGGGQSFSSGGPGKGLHSKLYQQALWRHGWLNSIECVTAWYRSAGFVAVYGTAQQAYAKSLFEQVLFHGATIASNITAADLEMAKQQLLSQLIVLGEPREVLVEDCAKFLLLHNQLHTTEELLTLGESITMDDFRRVCSKLVTECDPAMVFVGDTASVPFAKQAATDVKAAQKGVTDALRALHKTAKK